MDAWLQPIREHETAGTAITIGDGGPLSFGRANVGHHRGISSLHMSVQRTEEGSFSVVDHGSVNGTFVNAERVGGGPQFALH